MDLCNHDVLDQIKRDIALKQKLRLARENKRIASELLDDIILNSVCLQHDRPLPEISLAPKKKNDKIPIPNFLMKLYFAKLKPLMNLKQKYSLDSLIKAEKMILKKEKDERDKKRKDLLRQKEEEMAKPQSRRCVSSLI